MFVTLPVWISAAAALVTAGVTRLVAPVWSFGPHGEGLTIDLQSLCANAMGLDDKAITAKADISAARSMVTLLCCGSGSKLRDGVRERNAAVSIQTACWPPRARPESGAWGRRRVVTRWV